MSLDLRPLVIAGALACSPSEATDGGSGGESTSAGTLPGDTTSAEAAETDDGEDQGCGGFSIVPGEKIPWDVLLLVDASASMRTQTWDHDDDPLTPAVTRWASARALVERIIVEFGETEHLGVQRFPAQDACAGGTCTDVDVCLVGATPEVTLGPGQGPAILELLPKANADPSELDGASPARAAFLSVRDHLLAGPNWTFRRIVLISDGEANCGQGLILPESYETYDAELAATIEDAFKLDGLETIVVGVDARELDSGPGPDEDRPAVNTFAALNELAIVSGIPWAGAMEPRKFFDVREVDDVLDAIAPPEGLADCTIDLTTTREGPPDPVQIPYVSIVMNDEELPYVSDCANEDGWTWIEDGLILSLCGSWCQLFYEGTAVYGTYGCGEGP